MGLDVYLYKLIKENEFPDLIDSEQLSKECDSRNLSPIIFLNHQEYSHPENKRLIDLFEKFKDNVKRVVINNLIDYDYYESIYGKKIDGLDDICGYEIGDKLELYSSNKEYMRFYEEYKENNKDDSLHFSNICYVLLSGDEVLGVHKDLKTYSKEDSYLLFGTAGYARSNEHMSLYDNFYGDCWYKKENTGLDPKDTRYYVYPEEMEELKSCFNEHSNVHTWQLEDDEIVYLNP